MTLAGGFMVLLDVTIVTVAVPSMQRGLGASASGVQWVISGYPLMFGLALVAGGRLGDAFGRRRMYLISLTGFVLTSALAGAAPTTTLLIVARLRQGLAGGVITPQNTGLVQDLFRGAERGRAFGIFGATVGLSTAVGPVVGGLIINAFGATDGWRWVFYVNVPIGALAVLLAARLLPKTNRKVGASEIDVVGIVLLGLSVLCVLFPVVQSESGGLRRQWWLFPLAVLPLYAFLRWERRRAATNRPPVLDFRLFRATPGYPSGAVLGAVYFAGFSGIWLVFALFYQTGEHLSALQSGLAVTPFALGSAVSSAVAGRLVDRWRRWVTTIGLAMVTLGLAVTAWVVAVAPPGQVALWSLLPMLVAGVGGGAVIAPNTTLALANVPTRMAGVAGGLIQTGQRITSAIGTALMAAIYHAVATGIRFAAALLSAVGLVLIALVLGVRELRAERRWDPAG